MITIEQAKEVLRFLEETYSNSLYQDDNRANGYLDAMNDFEEAYITIPLKEREQ